MSYLINILANTGYTLQELIHDGVMNGKMIDHSKYGDCLCVDVSGCGIDIEGLHYKCSCDHPIRYEYVVTMKSTGESFPFGSTCIEHWKIRCPDCNSIKTFEECKTNTIDLWYRCGDCHNVFIDDRREKQKEERKRKKEEEKERIRIEEYKKIVEKREQEQKEEEERQRRWKEKLQKENRQCIDCKKYNISKTTPSFRIRCIPCYINYKNENKNNCM